MFGLLLNGLGAGNLTRKVRSATALAGGQDVRRE
jgi:hypothetical protein